MNGRTFLRLFPNASRSTLEANGALQYAEPEHYPQARPSMRGGSKKYPMWTSAEDTALRACIAEYKTSAEIASMMGRSKHGIDLRVRRLGLKHPRKPPAPYQSRAKHTDSERRALASARTKEHHARHGHPMSGRPVPNSVREKISAANKGRTVPPERTLRSLKTRHANGTLVFSHDANRQWKAGWRDIGDQHIYARSRWEANYARYLEFQRAAGLIRKWEHEPETFWFEKIKRGCRSFLIDFRVTKNDDTWEYHEVKGWMDARSKTKIKRMAKYYPQVVLIVRDAAWFKANRLKLRGIIAGWEDGK